MKMLRRLVLLCLFVCLPIAQAAPPVQSWWLDNGTRVYYIGSEQLPMVDVQLVFDAAGARDGDLPGLARLTNAMMSEGAGGRSAEEISLGFERLGAEFDSQSLKDMSVFSLRSLVEPDKLDEAVALLSDVLGKPDFPADAFERLRKQMLAALDAEAQSPRAIVNREFFKALYGDHPYAQPAQGTRESIERMTLEDIRAFYRHYMVGKNAVVAIVGDLDLIEASRLAERITAGLAPGEAAPALPKPEPLAESRTIRIHHPSTQTHIMTGQVGIARADLDLFSLYVGNHIFGGSGLVSMLSHEVREERGLSYSVGSSFVPMQTKGPFSISLQTRNDQADEALDVVRNTLARFMEKGPTDEQMEAAINNIGGSFPLGISSNSGLVAYLGVMGFYGLPLDYLELYVPRIVAETRETVHEAFRSHLDQDKFLTVIVGGGQPKSADVSQSGTVSEANR